MLGEGGSFAEIWVRLLSLGEGSSFQFFWIGLVHLGEVHFPWERVIPFCTLCVCVGCMCKECVLPIVSLEPLMPLIKAQLFSQHFDARVFPWAKFSGGDKKYLFSLRERFCGGTSFSVGKDWVLVGGTKF